MDSKQIQILVEKFIENSSSAKEEDMLMSWYRSANEQELEWLSEHADERELTRLHMLAEINRTISHSRVRHLGWRWIAAASILLFSAVGGYFLTHQKTLPVNTAIAKHDIAPGGNKAFLILANGQKISLTDAKNGQVAKQVGVKVTKTSGGLLVYTVSDSINSSSASRTLSYNTIETPNGGQYQVNLPDGTKVWLNSASSLKYPTSFNGIERKVTLTGEAYFEVAHNREHPFLVETAKETVTVLGTHFNVNTYDDEPAIKTTLLEGSVRVNTGSDKIMIKPGQQATLFASKLSINEVDTDEVMAWKDGKFFYNSTSLETIMRQVERWYDIKVVFNDEKLKSKTFSVISTRFAMASQLLHNLEMTGDVKFKIEGKKITVFNK